MFLDYEPGDFVINPNNRGWGTGQIQSIIKNKATVNFQESGKKFFSRFQPHGAPLAGGPTVFVQGQNAKCTKLKTDCRSV